MKSNWNTFFEHENKPIIKSNNTFTGGKITCLLEKKTLEKISFCVIDNFY